MTLAYFAATSHSNLSNMIALILTTLLSFASAERALVLARKTITSEFNQEFNGESLGNMLVEGRNVSQSWRIKKTKLLFYYYLSFQQSTINVLTFIHNSSIFSFYLSRCAFFSIYNRLQKLNKKTRNNINPICTQQSYPVHCHCYTLQCWYTRSLWNRSWRWMGRR